MKRISDFGTRKLATLALELSDRISESVAFPEGGVPTGDMNTPGERDDQLRSGDFRSRFEHIARYSESGDHHYGLVVDIGCGTGYGSLLLSRKNDVIGIDVSNHAIRYAAANYHGPHYVVGTADRIPVRSESIDAIVAFEVIEHLENPDGFIAECWRVLKVNGTLIVSSPNPAHIGNLLRKTLLGKRIPEKVNPMNPYHLKEFTYHEMLSFLSSNGFVLCGAVGQTLPLDCFLPRIGLLRYYVLGTGSLGDFVDWCLSELGRSFPSISWTAVYVASKARIARSH